MAKKLKNYNVLVKALSNFSLVNLDINVFNKKGENVFKKIKEIAASGWSNPYLSFIEENSEPFTLKTYNNSKNWGGTLEYSIDTQNWSEWNGTEVSSSDNGKLYLRGTGNPKITDVYDNRFVLTSGKRIQCQGNIETLLDYKTVEAGNHPVMHVGCYYRMFSGCTSLTTAPELPATTLADNCYSFMFAGCTSLTTAPELPATTLADKCYSFMFDGCTSLTTAPELSATTLASGCYIGMFSGCTSLTTAPELPATTLADNCYLSMFKSCTSLTGTIHCSKSTVNDSNRLDANAKIPANTATVVYDL
jgi:hypothetical protein